MQTGQRKCTTLIVMTQQRKINMSHTNNDLTTLIRFMESLNTLINSERASMTLEEKAKLGQQLDAVVKSTSDTLETLKGFLREEAFQICKGKAGDCQLTPECTVKFPHPVMRLKEDADVDALHKILGDDYLEIIEATTTHTLRKDAQTKILSNPKYLEALTGAIDIEDGKPRVFFKKDDKI